MLNKKWTFKVQFCFIEMRKMGSVLFYLTYTSMKISENLEASSSNLDQSNPLFSRLTQILIDLMNYACLTHHLFVDKGRDLERCKRGQTFHILDLVNNFSSLFQHLPTARKVHALSS